MDLLSNHREPLCDYPWKDDAERLIQWVKPKDRHYHAFIFDVCMSLAYIDTSRNLENSVEHCPNCPDDFNGHLGFINLCSPCYELGEVWQYQQAAKPSSGALGKLSSEIILKFVEIIFDDIVDTFAIGGSGIADAFLKFADGSQAFAEVKSAPLLTYPVLVKFKQAKHKHVGHNLTSSQFKLLPSAMYMHDGNYIDMGQIKSEGWPFKGIVDYFLSSKKEETDKLLETWLKTRSAYRDKDRNSPYYYLANASGAPPKVAKDEHNWPVKASISDGKTSAGIDRTDDIKKGIYQTMKIGAKYFDIGSVKSALISNLPAYRHGEEYIEPFMTAVWGREADFEIKDGESFLSKRNTRKVFDYFITLDE